MTLYYNSISQLNTKIRWDKEAMIQISMKYMPDWSNKYIYIYIIVFFHYFLVWFCHIFERSKIRIIRLKLSQKKKKQQQQQKINLYQLPPGPHSPWHHGRVSTFAIDWVQNIQNPIWAQQAQWSLNRVHSSVIEKYNCSAILHKDKVG